MMDPKRLTLIAITGLLLALPAAASDPTSVGSLGAGVLAQASADLQACAQQQGLALDSDTSFLTQKESTMAFAPIAGIEALTRDQLVNWTVVGLFTAQGPANAEAPSGTYRVEVRADLQSTNGDFRIVDRDGIVVQSGDLIVETDADATPPTATNEPFGVGMPLDGKGPLLDGIQGVDGKGYYFGTFACPWYYPYFAPYFFRYWPTYKHGCYHWYYRFYWGYFHWRFCWWPSRYCVNCRHHW